jgi:hypothetical protein
MSKKKLNNLEVIPALEKFIVPLHEEEFKQLEKNIRKDGCREPLTVWPTPNKDILVDGHNRYKICSKYGIPFRINQINFHNLEEAKVWIINNQMGRRNLNPDQMSYYRGMKYESLKKNRGGYEFVESIGQNDGPTTEKLAKEFNVSESTITRDARYARGLEFIGERNPILKKNILNGKVKVKKTSINLLSNPEFQKKIRTLNNEEEIENKVEKIKNQIFTEMEQQLSSAKGDKVKESQEYLAGKEPAFLDTEDKLRRIKGMILSSLNKAIKNRDAKSLDEIRKLIDRLQEILD